MQRRSILKLLGGVTIIGTILNAKNSKDKYFNEPEVDADINMKIVDQNDMTKNEMMHSPTIKVDLDSIDKRGTLLVEVSVGAKGKIHKSTKSHFISDIKLYVNEQLTSSVKLSPNISRGYLGVRIKETELKNLRATATCNLHGTWTTKAEEINGKWKNTRI